MPGEDIQELQKDCAELQRLLDLTDRPNVKGILTTEIEKVQEQIAKSADGTNQEDESTEVTIQPEEVTPKLEEVTPKPEEVAPKPEEVTPKPEEVTQKSEKVAPKTKKPPKEVKSKAPVKLLATNQIKSYGWDQSEKFVKLYITVNGVGSIPAENIKVEYNEQSFRLLVKNLQGSYQELFIHCLFGKIVPGTSYHKVKTDEIVLLLRKAEQDKWTYLKATEQNAKEKKTPKFDSKKDPNDSIMEMMKNMYDEGDDDMKRMIAKAWTEGRGKGDMMGGPPGGMME